MSHFRYLYLEEFSSWLFCYEIDDISRFSEFILTMFALLCIVISYSYTSQSSVNFILCSEMIHLRKFENRSKVTTKFVYVKVQTNMYVDLLLTRVHVIPTNFIKLIQVEFHFSLAYNSTYVNCIIIRYSRDDFHQNYPALSDFLLASNLTTISHILRKKNRR